MKKITCCFFALLFLTTNVFAQKKVKLLLDNFLSDPVIENAHAGIYLYDVEAKKEVLNYQGNKLFTPASNTKLLSLFVGSKYIGDSLPGMLYMDDKDTLYLCPTGDPSFLAADFSSQPLDTFLRKNKKPVVVYTLSETIEPFAKGWAMDDKDASYAPERNIFPVWGNVMTIESIRIRDSFITVSTEALPENYQIKYTIRNDLKSSEAHRDQKNHQLQIEYSPGDTNIKMVIPFETEGVSTTCHLLQKRYGHPFIIQERSSISEMKWDTLFSQPADSLFRIMMHRSDNMYAEHILLMGGFNRWGIQDDEKIRKKIWEEDLKDLPQEVKWHDGSGLSRYNLFSPKDMVLVVMKLMQTIGINRLKTILPTGGSGTLSNYYLNKKGLIFAKTGTLRNVVCLSGFMETASKKNILFSVMINNHQTSAKAVRTAVEKLLTTFMDSY